MNRHALLRLLLCILMLSAAQTAAARAMRIVLDSGHNPGQSGALGVRGIYEMIYNDALTARLAHALRARGYEVYLTRAPTQQISLEDRARYANDLHADLFLAIHHDSAQPQYLERIQVDGREARRTTRPLSGYSIFVSLLNPKADNSRKFAALLGTRLRALERPPALHHAEAIAGENRELLDHQLGIYRFDDLVVLKKTDMPAALLEVGVITDPADEAYVSNADNQAKIVDAIVAAVRQYF
ncbi:MAG: N-acetylmuramoyl-L-alanine amidase, partial [Gallionellaceae bacterium]|nr:N-acetylmuramoyl-L-alanine amidase [Gallionellaceae bacterium]